MKLHTVPTSMHTAIVTRKGRGLVSVAIVTRGGETLAMYPADLCKHRMPTMREAQADARWQAPEVTQ